MTNEILTPFLDDADVIVYEGDCIAVMARMPEASVDAVVTDPPYGLEFMGKDWDRFSPVDLDRGGRWTKDKRSGPGNTKRTDSSTPQGRTAIAYGAGRSYTSECKGCGRRDAFRNDHDCGDVKWERVPVDDGAPPQMLAFQTWVALWCAEALRILKPGGHLLAFGGTRTYHRLAAGIEDAGFEIRDCLAWLYGSGFPKSLDVSKAIDKQRDDKAEIYEVTAWIREKRDDAGVTNRDIDAAFGTNGMAGHWTSSKSQPAVPTLEQVPHILEVLGVDEHEVPERIKRLLLDLNGRKGQPGEAWFQREVVGSKKSSLGGTVAAKERDEEFINKHRELEFDITAPATDAAKQWEGWGTALKPAFEPIVLARKPLIGTVAANVLEHGTGALNIDGCRIGMGDEYDPDKVQRQSKSDGAVQFASAGLIGKEIPTYNPHGRWPANVTLDEDAAAMLDKQSGVTTSGAAGKKGTSGFAAGYDGEYDIPYGDRGGASRFFYTAKASRQDRNTSGADNTHPTVKPTDLMRWLIRLATPPGGVILDPFGGSGSTGVAARAEGVRCVLIEREDEYLQIIRQRLAQQSLFGVLCGEDGE